MSSVLVACMAPIALCHLTRDHLTRSLKSRNATVGDKTWNPGFKSVTLLKVTGGLMDRLNGQRQSTWCSHRRARQNHLIIQLHIDVFRSPGGLGLILIV